jgi:hypothetical protein
LFPWTASARAIAFGRINAVTKLLFDDSPEVHANGVHGNGSGFLAGGAYLALAFTMSW